MNALCVPFFVLTVGSERGCQLTVFPPVSTERACVCRGMLVSTAELVGTERVCQLTAVPTSTGQNLWVLSFFALTCQHLSVPSVWRDDGFHRSTYRNRAHVQGIAPCTLTVVSAGQYLSVPSALLAPNIFFHA